MAAFGALTVTGALALSGVGAARPGATDSDGAEWAGSWATAVAHGNETGSTHDGFEDQSVRMVVHTSVGGGRLKIRLSNLYGEQDVRVGHATVARPDTSTPELSDIDPATVRELTFNGAKAATMQQGGELWSDPANLAVGSQKDLVVTVYFPTPTGPTTFHATSRQHNFVGDTDLTEAAGGEGFGITRDCCWFFLSGVDVERADSPGSVVVLSDSIGDGNASTIDTNQRWPDLLADRLIKALPAELTPGVLNASNAGSRLNHEGDEDGAGGFPGFPQLGVNSQARLGEDVFSQTDVRTVITHLGINDIWMSNDSADEIIAALRQINTQLKHHGLRNLVGTITPYEGHGAEGVWTPAKEATRQAVNAYLRSSEEFDGLVDFDLALRDPDQPSKLLAAYDSGDHIHPNDLGNQAMADAVTLSLLFRG
ncbi:MAG: SGNH/GDSL hydrolase family protein [Micromonosporaceae bacterium]